MGGCRCRAIQVSDIFGKEGMNLMWLWRILRWWRLLAAVGAVCPHTPEDIFEKKMKSGRARGEGGAGGNRALMRGCLWNRGVCFIYRKGTG
jgi:hypothetical protein